MARSHNLRLVDVARDVIAGSLPPPALTAARALADDEDRRCPRPAGDARYRRPCGTDRGPRRACRDRAGARHGRGRIPGRCVEVVASDLAVTLGAEQVRFLIADLTGDSLVRIVRPHPGGLRDPAAAERLEPVAMAGHRMSGR